MKFMLFLSMCVVRRSGGLQPLAVNVALTGAAARHADYVLNIAGHEVAFAPGQREAFVEILAVADFADGEPEEDVVLTALPGAGYSLGTVASAGVVMPQSARRRPAISQGSGAVSHPGRIRSGSGRRGRR